MRAHLTAVLGLAAVVLTFAPGSANAEPGASTELSRTSYAATFARAVDSCEQRTPRGSLADLRRCVTDLAAPDPADAYEVDLWHIFLDCLAKAQKDLDDMYPYNPNDVNDCLEDHGVDVGP